MKRVCSVILILAMLLALVPTAAFAADGTKAISIAATGGEKTITVEAQDAPETGGGQTTGKVLKLSAQVETPLARDYDQKIDVQVENLSDQPVEYYLEVDNDNEDLYMNFVKSGSVDAPLTIQPGATQTVELSVFAQNARRTYYTVDVTGVVSGGERVQMALSFPCAAAEGVVSFTKGSVDPNTLATTYTVRNSGTTDISDLTLTLSGDAVEYVRISPSVENYELSRGEALTIKLIPDLSKMKANQQTLITGTLNASGGTSGSAALSFDTQGQEITVTTIGELALMQADNPYHDIEFDEDSFVFTTNNGTKSQTMQEITARYYEEGNPAKDGVNTADEFMEVMDALFDESGMIDFTIEDEMVFNNGTERIPVSVRVTSEVVEQQTVARSSVQDVGTTYNSNTHEMTTTYKLHMTMKEYREYVEEIGEAGKWLKITDLPSTILGDSGTTADQIEVTVTSSMASASLDFLAAYVDSPDNFIDFSKVDNIGDFADNYKQVADFADALKPLDTLGKASDYIGTGVDLYNTASVWTNPDPNISTEDKVLYTGLQVAKNVNTYVGGKLLSKAGTAIGTAVADGPGAIVGFFAGHVISGLIGFGLEKWTENMEDQMFGGAIYYDIYGRQCTNAGKVTSNFYLPDIDTTDVGMYETGRMYDGSPYGGNAGYADEQFGGNQYIHNRSVNYDYYINGTKVGSTQNNGLTSVSMVDLSQGAAQLKPGKNTIVRDYDTNAGHYSVIADTEITILYPSDTPISYIGSPETLEEVRLMPDFAVYWENILPKYAAILGEENEVTINLYNRGSMGGWADVTVTDGKTVIYSGENLYLGAFSEKQVTFNWTPVAEESQLMVTLENKTVGVDERKSDNNTASRTIEARSRQVPVIGEIVPKTVVQDDIMHITANLSQVADLASVSIKVDDTTYQGNQISLAAIGDAGAQAALAVRDLAVGSHSIDVSVGYYTGVETTATVKKSQTLTVTAPGTVNFSVDSTVTEPSFLVLEMTDQWETINTKIIADGSSYTLTKTASMAENPHAFYLLTYSVGGFILTPISSLNEETPLSLANGKAVTVGTDGNDSIALGNVYLDAIDGRSINGRPRMTLDQNQLKVQGAESLELMVNFKVDDFSSSATVSQELSEGSSTIDLSAYYRLYEFTLTDAPDNLFYVDALLTVKKANYTYTLYGDIAYDDETKKLDIFVDGSYSLERLEDAETVEAALTCEDTLYTVDLKNYSSPIQLTRETYCALTFTCATGELEDLRADIHVGNEEVRLYGNPLYIPQASYPMLVSYTVDGESLWHVVTANATAQDVSVPLPGVAENAAQLKVNWPSWMGSDLTLSYQIEKNGQSWNAYTPVEQGAPVTIAAGEQRLSFDLTQVGENGRSLYYVTVTKEMTLEAGKISEVTLDGAFSGTAQIGGNANTVYAPGDSCTMYFEDLLDENGNSLDYYSSYDYSAALRGVITFTAENGTQYNVEVDQSWFGAYSLGFALPEDMASGVYTYTLLLTNAAEPAESSQHTIIASAETGGTITPSGSVTVEHGADQSFSIIPDSGYAVQDVLVDGISQGAISSYTFTDVVDDHTITVRWKSTGSAPSRPVSPSRPVVPETPAEPDPLYFADVRESDWFYDAVCYVTEHGIMVGVGNGEFNPSGTVTRAMVWTVLARLAEEDTDHGATWYSDAQAWAMKTGVSDGSNPMGAISREQLAAMLYRFSGSPAVSGNLSEYPDGSAVSDWAKDAMVWATQTGLVNGINGFLSPKTGATRAQLATLLMRMLTQ